MIRAGFAPTASMSANRMCSASRPSASVSAAIFALDSTTSVGSSASIPSRRNAVTPSTS